MQHKMENLIDSNFIENDRFKIVIYFNILLMIVNFIRILKKTVILENLRMKDVLVRQREPCNLSANHEHSALSSSHLRRSIVVSVLMLKNLLFPTPPYIPVLTILIFLTGFSQFSSAAIILSTCRAFPTDLSRGSGPSQPQLTVPQPEPYFSSADHVRAFIESRFPHRTSSSREDVANFQDTLRRIDDLRVYFRSQDIWSRHAGSEECTSTNQTIETFMAPFAPGARPEDLRVGYKICTFFRNQNLEVGIEGSCRVIGRSEGYSLKEISDRFVRIDDTVQKLQTGIRVTVLLGAVYGTYRFYRIAGGLSGILARGSLGAIATRTTFVAIPSLAAYAALELTNIDSMPIQHLVDLRDAASLLYNGRRQQVIHIDQPIEDFELVLADYLNTIPVPEAVISELK